MLVDTTIGLPVRSLAVDALQVRSWRVEQVVFEFYGHVNRSTVNSAFFSNFPDRAVEVEKTCATNLADVGSDLANPPN